MKTNQKIIATKSFEIAGYAGIELPNKTLLLPKLQLSFASRGEKGDIVRNKMIALLLSSTGLASQLRLGVPLAELLKEYSNDYTNIVKLWLTTAGWDVCQDHKPEETPSSWLIKPTSISTPELVVPTVWLDFWESLILQGYSPEILKPAHAFGFPQCPPSQGDGKILVTKEQWKYIWVEQKEGVTRTMSKTLNNRKWGPETETKNYQGYFEDGFEQEPILMEHPNFQVQAKDGKKGWLNDLVFQTLKQAKTYLLEEDLSEDNDEYRIVNTQSGQIL
jgi:hypothetical protein